jgi:2'-5' RNA ligase
MDHRYLLAVALPASPHISLEFPFFLADRVGERDFLSRLAQIPFFAFTTTLTKTGTYRQKGKTILYLRAQPETKFLELHGELRRELQEYYRLDTSVYDNGVVPMYESHLTLSYDFAGSDDQRKTLTETLKDLQFEVSEIELFKELETGVWVTMGSNH